MAKQTPKQTPDEDERGSLARPPWLPGEKKRRRVHLGRGKDKDVEKNDAGKRADKIEGDANGHGSAKSEEPTTRPHPRPQRDAAENAVREPPPKRDRIPVSRAKLDSPAEPEAKRDRIRWLDPNRTPRRRLRPKPTFPRSLAPGGSRCGMTAPGVCNPIQFRHRNHRASRRRSLLPRRRRSPMTLRLHRLHVQTNNRSQPSRRRRRAATAPSIPAWLAPTRPSRCRGRAMRTNYRWLLRRSLLTRRHHRSMNGSCKSLRFGARGSSCRRNRNPHQTPRRCRSQLIG